MWPGYLQCNLADGRLIARCRLMNKRVKRQLSALGALLSFAFPFARQGPIQSIIAECRTGKAIKKVTTTMLFQHMSRLPRVL